MTVFDMDPEFPHERVVFCRDRSSGLRAIIAVHDTTLGPAAGGCRVWAYPDEQAAVADALRLSTAMTWKNALAGLPLGGGKSVILADRRTDLTVDLLHAFGRCVEELRGRYWVAEDVGIGTQEVSLISETAHYTFGRGTDPSPWTALGGLMGIAAAVEDRLGSGLEGARVAVQGVGHVGLNLVRLLVERGASVIASDIDGRAVEAAAILDGVDIADPDTIYDADVHVFAPCALGASLNADTIPRLKASIVCGLANNQLATPEDGHRLHDRGILYVPDFVVNSGGMLSVAGPILGKRESEAEIRAKVEGIGRRVREIIGRARETEAPPADVADLMARETVLAGRRRNG